MISEHRFTAARLSAYRDDDLPDDEHRRVRTHLRGCRPCRETLDEMAMFASRLRTSSTPPPAGLAERVIAHLDAESPAIQLRVVDEDTSRAPRHPSRPVATVAAQWSVTRGHLRTTLPLAILVGIAITLLKDLGPLLADGLTTQNCVVCGLNFVLSFVLMNVGIMLASSRRHTG